MSMLFLLAGCAVVGRVTAPAQAPAELVLGGMLAALWGAAAAARDRLLPVVLLCVSAAFAGAVAPKLAGPTMSAAARGDGRPAVGVVRWARATEDGTLAWIDPAEAARGPPAAEPLAGPVRMSLIGRRSLEPGSLVLVPASAARAARAGAATGDRRGAPTVGVSPDDVVRLASGDFGDGATAARRALERSIEARAASAAPALRSMVLGEAWRLPSRERDALRDIGVSHLLAISGFNLALLAWLLGFALLALARLHAPLLLRCDVRRVAAAVVLPAVWGFTAVVDWQPSVVRAALMISAVLGSRLLGRRATVLDALALAVLAVFVAVPEEAADPGFQLSFAAVAGLLVAARVVRAWEREAERRGARPFRSKWGEEGECGEGGEGGKGEGGSSSSLVGRSGRVGGLGARGWVGEWAGRVGRWVVLALVASVFAALATAPIAAWHFGTVAPASPLANLVAVPLFTFVVYPLALVAALVAASPLPAGASEVCAAAAGWAWDGFVRVCEGLGRVLPGPVGPGADGTAGVAVWAALIALLFHPRGGPRRVALFLMGLLCVSPADAGRAARPASGPPRAPAGAAELVFIDVGDGDATLCILPDGSKLLVDGGGAPGERNRGPRSRALTEELKRRGIRRIDRVILSHPHPDHFGGLVEVSRRVAFGELWISPQAETERPEGEVSRWVAGMEGKGTIVRRTPGICGRHDAGGAELEVLSPCGAKGFDAGLDENDNSVVVRLCVGEACALLTGDAGVGAEGRLLEGGAVVQADVLKVAHHGSRTSTSEAFVAAVGARWAIVSAAPHRADYRGPPHGEVLARLVGSGAEVVPTAIDGTITVHLGREGVGVYGARGGGE
ncbi:MAG: ComEC/Rec2 family competence protein [Deltaproteobacteria bacterium]|nr:ComEC/Rec2 family competence protein [Deltaproteobacteria bacterium]